MCRTGSRWIRYFLALGLLGMSACSFNANTANTTTGVQTDTSSGFIRDFLRQVAAAALF